MENKTFYFQSNESLKIKQEIINFLKHRLKKNPSRVRNIETDELLKSKTEHLMHDIIIDYHHPLFIVQNNKIEVFEHSILDNVFSKEQLFTQLKSLQGIIKDDEGNSLDYNELKELQFEDKRHFNFEVLQSHRPDFLKTYEDQFFYLSNRVCVKIAVATQRFLYNLAEKYNGHIINMHQYIANNLLTEWIMTFIPQSLVLFGEVKQNQLAPILFEIGNYWGGANSPLLATNFITQNVPNNWLFLSTQNLLQADFDFHTLLNNRVKSFYLGHEKKEQNKDKVSNDLIENLYQFYFLQRNEIPELIDNKQIISYIRENTTRSYPNSIMSAFVNGKHKYYFEVAKIEDLLNQ